MSDIGNGVLPTVRAIADVTGHPLASYAVEGVNVLNDIYAWES